MGQLKDYLFAFLTKIEKLDYFLVIVLWAVGALASAYGFPWIVLGILGLHAFEAVVVGIKTGLDAGESLPYTLVMTMTFGFTWWVPTKFRTAHKDEK